MPDGGRCGFSGYLCGMNLSLKQIAILSVALIAGIVADDIRAYMPDSLLTEVKIRRLVVSNPDSVLRLIDLAEARDVDGFPAYRRDVLRAVAYNELRMFWMKEKYALRALADDSIVRAPDVQVQALMMAASAQAFYGRYGQSIETCMKAMEIAREIGNIPAEYNILTTMAKTSFDMGERERGYGYLEQILSRGESSQSVRVLANVSSAIGMKVIQLYADDRYADALRESGRRMKVIDRIARLGGAPEGFVDQQRAYTYAREASTLIKLGRRTEAAQAYRRFLATTYGSTVEGRAFITDYLIDAGKWSTVIEFTRPMFGMFQASDTINDDYWSLLYSNAQAYAGLGDTGRGYGLMCRAAAIRDSLYLREKSSHAQELATLFALNDRELALEQSRTAAQHRNMIIAIMSCVLFTLAALFVMSWVSLRRERRRNVIAARQIDELTQNREDMRKYMMKDAAMENVEAVSAADTGVEDDAERLLFVDMESRIMGNRLFLYPSTSVREVAGLCGLSQAKVQQLVTKYAGCSFKDYMMRLKVEQSVSLMKKHPEWTIEAIAKSAGFNSRNTFYQNFNRLYGMTPAQYRKIVQ